MGEDAADGVQAGLGGLAGIVAVGQEHVDVVLPQRDVVVTAVGRHAHEGLRHETGEQPELTTNLAADLAISGEPVGRVLRQRRT